MRNHLIDFKVVSKVDECPDISFIGEYTDTPDQWNIVADTGEFCIDTTDFLLKKRSRLRFFKPYAGGALPGTPEYKKYAMQDFQRMQAYQNHDFCFIGIIAKAQIWNPITEIINVVHSGGIWGVESDSNKKYLETLANEQIDQLKTELSSLGFGSRAITYAIKRYYSGEIEA